MAQESSSNFIPDCAYDVKVNKSAIKQRIIFFFILMSFVFTNNDIIVIYGFNKDDFFRSDGQLQGLSH